MSIIVCESCSRYVDTDFPPDFEGKNGGRICEVCEEKKSDASGAGRNEK